jgi:hypothetical protein
LKRSAQNHFKNFSAFLVGIEFSRAEHSAVVSGGANVVKKRRFESPVASAQKTA